MKLHIFPQPLTVCQLDQIGSLDRFGEFCCLLQTPGEITLVCPTDCAPQAYIQREDGWRALYVDGVLEFELVGILADISSVLAEAGVSIFALSTYNTDYILVKEDKLQTAVQALCQGGYTILP